MKIFTTAATGVLAASIVMPQVMSDAKQNRLGAVAAPEDDGYFRALQEELSSMSIPTLTMDPDLVDVVETFKFRSKHVHILL